MLVSIQKKHRSGRSNASETEMASPESASSTATISWGGGTSKPIITTVQRMALGEHELAHTETQKGIFLNTEVLGSFFFFFFWGSFRAGLYVVNCRSTCLNCAGVQQPKALTPLVAHVN